jgi:hypothetical protein
MRCGAVPLLLFGFLLEEAATVFVACNDTGMESDRLNAAGLNVSVIVDMSSTPPGRTLRKGDTYSYRSVALQRHF